MKYTQLTILAFVAAFLTSAAEAKGPGEGNRLIMATYWGDDRVALIDTQAEPGHEEMWSIDTLKAVGCAKPYDVRVGPQSDKAYVTCSGSNKIAVIDIVAQQVLYSLETGSSPRDLQLYDGGKKLIVANSGSDTVSVIDTEKRQKLFDFPVATQPYGVAVTPDGRNAYVTGWASGDLHIVQLTETSGKVISTIKVGLLPYTVVAPGDGNTAYVAANGSQRVIAVDLKTRKITKEVVVGRNPWSLATTLDGKNILVTNNRSNNLSLLSTGAAPTVKDMGQKFISAGAQRQPSGDSVSRAAKNASFSADGLTAVFTDLANNQIVVIDVVSGGIKRVIDVGRAPYGVEYVR